MNNRTLSLLTTLLLAPLAALPAAETKLAGVFTDHTVLQRDAAVPIWGWADAGAEITVEFAGAKKTTKADAAGKWMVKLDPMPASVEPRELKANGASISDVLVGDVWLASGQSNMFFNVKDTANAEQEIAHAQYPQIRSFTVAQNPSLAPADNVQGTWQPCSPQTVGSFSGVAYYFGRELHQDLRIPIGLLHSSVGGTPAEAWTRLGALQSVPIFSERAAQEIAQIKAQPEAIKRFPGERSAWEEKFGVKPTPISDTAKGWADPALDTVDWKKVTLPSQWGQLGFKSGGAFWVRKEIDLPAEAAGKPFTLKLISMSEQYDTAYWNGVEIGHAPDAPPEYYLAQRAYRVPGEHVKVGRNVIAIRIFSATEKAGLWQWGKKLEVPVSDPGAINDEWLLKQESTLPALPPDALASRPKPNNIPFRTVSSALYNGMIAPLVPFALKGAIWYQGESNAPRHAEYRDLLSLMIRDWRTQWQQGDFPFIIQQLVNNDAPPKDAQDQHASWPFLREAQRQVANTVPNCGMAVGIELGSQYTIHPTNKQDVGKRLALVALEKTYGHKIESSGPQYQTMKEEAAALRVSFSHAQGLNAKGGPLQRFAIAGEDRKFVWADAKIEGDSVIVSSSQVTAPVAVRYAWATNPEGCNLYNGAGLPASPFRTDDWK